MNSQTKGEGSPVMPPDMRELSDQTAGQPPKQPATAAPGRWHRLRRWAAKASWVVCSLAVVLLLLEGATRLLSDTSASLFENDPVLGNRYRRAYQGSPRMPESGERVYFHTNREGLRDRDRHFEKPPQVCRVAVLGDSMVAAMATPEDHTAVRVLEDMLNASHPQVRWDVMNCGVSGFSTAAELVAYREVVRKYDPDVVLCCFCAHNDLGDNSRELTSNPHRVYFELDEQDELQPVPIFTPRSSLSAWLNRHSRFYVWQKHATSMLIGKSKESLGILPSGKLAFCREESGEVERAWALTGKLIAALRTEVTADGAQFAMVLLPSANQIYQETWQQDLQQAGPLAAAMEQDYVEARLRGICEQQGVILLTMTDRFRQAAPHRSVRHENELLHYAGIGHFNDAGNRLAAEVMHRFLIGKHQSQHVAARPFVRRLR